MNYQLTDWLTSRRMDWIFFYSLCIHLFIYLFIPSFDWLIVWLVDQLIMHSVQFKISHTEMKIDWNFI